MELFIDNRQDKIIIEKEIYNMLKILIKEILIMEKSSLNYEISISFVDNEEIRSLNKDYRNIDKETDVLSFPQSNDFVFEGPVILGDIIISGEKAFEQSKEFGHSLYREICYLATHSMFHLLGYNHIDEEDKKIMRFKEKTLMEKVSIFRDNQERI